MRFKTNNKTHPGPQIKRIIDEYPCSVHDAAVGIPCYRITPGSHTNGYLSGVCGLRIKKVGFTGRISDMAIRRTGFTKPNRR